MDVYNNFVDHGEEFFYFNSDDEKVKQNDGKCDRVNFRKKYKKKKLPTFSEPITSYGIILFSLDPEEKEPLFLLYQRRDNFEYMDFLRGMWKTEGQLPALFSSMSEEERKRIRNYTFQELWDDLWVIKDCRMYRDGFIRAKRKYDSIKDKIPFLLDTTTSCVKEPPWGFPKGKKNGYSEESIDCAIREFKEETKLDISSSNIIQDIPFTENFKGSNGKAYATHYYLAEIPIPLKTEKYDTPNCIRKITVSEEASEIKWFNFSKACQYLNPRRQNILRSVLEIINERQRRKT